jgi:hypothetical protein
MILPLSRCLAAAGNLDGFVPVASGGGGLVALWRTMGAPRDTARICVCNPLARTSTFLPPLPPLFVPEKIIFLEADGSSFRLLAVMEDQHGLLLRVFCSQTGRWDAAMVAGLPDNMVMIDSSPAVVHRGAVHWIYGTHALPNAVHTVVVRLTEAATSVSRIDLPPCTGLHCLTEASRAVHLTNSVQDTLFLVLVDELILYVWNLEKSSLDGKQWSYCKAIHLMPMLPPINFSCRKVELSIQGLCEKSGSLFLHLVGEGLFMFNVKMKKLVKVCKDHFGNCLCPYVPDIGSFLAAMKKFLWFFILNSQFSDQIIDDDEDDFPNNGNNNNGGNGNNDEAAFVANLADLHQQQQGFAPANQNNQNEQQPQVEDDGKMSNNSSVNQASMEEEVFLPGVGF